jgi:DNA polymerase-1
MQADEQSDLYRWIASNVPGATLKNAGAFISHAPADLVGRYAIGDVVRTRHLFDLLKKQIDDLEMNAAYDRERKLMPTLVYGTKDGIRLDRDTLEYHETVYTKALDRAKGTIHTIVGVHPDDSNEAFADGLDRIGAVSEWILTPTKKRSFAKGNIHISHPELKAVYEYAGALETCLSTFIRPWLEYSRLDGRIHPNWNQVRQARTDRDSKGTRTGRLSSDGPNFQNVPNEFRDRTGHPLVIPEGLVPLPVMRRYCLPEEGHVWLKRDFSSQEIRILAHFEDGTLCEAYRINPDLDPHEMARQIINTLVGVLYARKDVKITGFGIIYGIGARGLSIQLGQPQDDAYRIKEAYLTAMPGVRNLMDSVQRRGRNNQPIRTWGGRLYYSEPSKVIEGRLRDFHYKLLNYLIQGSAADQTKEAINDWRDARRWNHIFVATVHDEINLSAPREEASEAMRLLREAMDADRFDVPFRSEGFMGDNWADLVEYEG